MTSADMAAVSVHIVSLAAIATAWYGAVGKTPAMAS
jgi:hypothetical protein